MFVIGFVVGCCVRASKWLAWCYKLFDDARVMMTLLPMEVVHLQVKTLIG